ncbi:endonuclease/exonuclease/phosphatase family protein [Paenibacillus mendelii]|uniref:Endonuclease/exonuclease/phosphatase family protein n=1 Tax=Paenibacillus mendelii TaxID=206163 RepID=A0ABV6JFA7_9BACL|nr:endonuclease/exonuclease/phosphatase family protein [Paenibacillus mendelii]MCQ6557356.1 endonuclease/exonuclease/phosphatase family protein [Paenibacillus mendelii]
MKMSVMTLNLRIHVPSDGDNAWPHRVHAVADLIQESNPVILGTQEGSYGMLNDLDGLLPAYSRIGEGRLGLESGQSQSDELCAIYYKHAELTVIRHGQFWLSETPEVPGSKSWDSSLPRICTWICFELKQRPGTRFYTFNTHFDHMGQQAREESAKLIIARIRQLREEEHLPAMLMGDLNAHPDNDAIKLLREQLSDAYSILSEPVGRTFHNFEGGVEGQPIDYIFATSDVKLTDTLVDRKLRNGKYPSDHYSIAVSVTLT